MNLTEIPINSKLELKKLKSKDINDPLNEFVLNQGYWIYGYLINPIKIGEKIQVLRTNRNGIGKLGIFTTSNVVDIQEDVVQTANSYWKIAQLENEN